MDILQEVKDSSRTTFFQHVFSSNESSQAELFNALQYTLLAIMPIILFNKFIHRFIPEVDLEKSSVEIILEIILQLLCMIGGIILIHRIITYIPTYSGFKYDNMNIINVILIFLLIILSFQSKLGLKTNIISDRVVEIWNGHDNNNNNNQKKKQNNEHHHHHDSDAGFPPFPQTQTQNQPAQNQIQSQNQYHEAREPQPANSFINFK
jgi:hypothetical protein